MKSLTDIRFYFSPIDRLYHTYPRPVASEFFGVNEKEPVFVFGSKGNKQKIIGIASFEDAINHINIQPSGLFYLIPSEIDENKLFSYCIENGYIKEKNKRYTFNSKGMEYSFQKSTKADSIKTVHSRISI